MPANSAKYTIALLSEYDQAYIVSIAFQHHCWLLPLSFVRYACLSSMIKPFFLSLSPLPPSSHKIPDFPTCISFRPGALFCTPQQTTYSEKSIPYKLTTKATAKTMVSRDDFHLQYTTNHPSGKQPADHESQLQTSPIHSGFDAADYHQQQSKHYHSSRGHGSKELKDLDRPPVSAPPPRPPPKDDHSKYGAANEKATRRKPVPSRDPKLGPPPASRKHTVSAEEIGLKAPMSRPEPVAAPGAERYINMRADGKFDVGTIHPGSPEQTRMPPPPSTSFDTFPNLVGALPQSRPMPKTNFGPVEDDTTYPSERPGLKRSDSSRSIKDGLKDLGARVRRGSNEFFHNIGRAASIAAKHPVDRKKYENCKASEKRESARQRSAERESACQENPELRPPHEAEGVRRKNFEKFEREQKEGKRDSEEHNPYTYDPNKSQAIRDAERRARHEERHAPYHLHSKNSDEGGRGRRPSIFLDTQQAKTGGGPHGPPSPAESFQSSISLTPSERHDLRDEEGLPHRKPSPPLDGWERAGMKVGHMLDPMRRKRSDESDFFTDAAIDGALEPCVRCKEPPESCLKAGLCEDCRNEIKEVEKHGKRHRK